MVAGTTMIPISQDVLGSISKGTYATKESAHLASFLLKSMLYPSSSQGFLNSNTSAVVPSAKFKVKAEIKEYACPEDTPHPFP